MEKLIVLHLYNSIGNDMAYRHLYGHLIIENGLSVSDNDDIKIITCYKIYQCRIPFHCLHCVDHIRDIFFFINLKVKYMPIAFSLGFFLLNQPKQL